MEERLMHENSEIKERRYEHILEVDKCLDVYTITETNGAGRELRIIQLKSDGEIIKETYID